MPAPLIVNLLPLSDQADFDLTGPVRLTVRDPDTYVSAALLHVSIGYAQTHGDGDVVFDADTGIPGTFMSASLPGPLDSTKADIQVAAEGIQITKTIAGLQRSVAFTPIEAGVGFKSAMVSAVVRPDIVTVGEEGAILGMEHGPRNTGVYLFFDDPGGGKQIRITGPADAAGVRVPDRAVAFDWTAIQRYIIIWNERMGVVELYSVTSSATTLVTTELIANFQQFDLDSGLPTVRQGGAGALTAVYGIEGASGDRVTIGSISITAQVAYPIVGISRPGQFETVRRTDESVRYTGGDPREVEISPWFGPPNSNIFPSSDAAGDVTVLDEGARLSKITAAGTYGFHREEPGLTGSSTDGYILDAEFFATPTVLVGGIMTGMGFIVHDGTTSLFLALLVIGGTRTVGLLNAGVDVTTIGNYSIPITKVDWSSPVRFRLSVDPRRNKVDLYLASDIKTPVLSIPFNRSALPVPATLGLTGQPPLLAFGHVTDTFTAGSFELRNLKYSHTYQAWEGLDAALPNASPTDPLWTPVTLGFQEISPLYGGGGLYLLGGGFGPSVLGYFFDLGSGPSATASITAGNQMQIVADPGETLTYQRGGSFDIHRGVILEISLQITSHKPRARSGCFLIIDDGINAHMLSFVDTDIGKFAAVPVRSGLDGFVEVVGVDGDSEDLSFRIDWDEPHTYRFERRPVDGLYVFVDNNKEPALVIPDRSNVDYPTTQFAAPTIAFGVRSGEGSISLWDYARVMFGSGYEVSFKLRNTTEELEENIRNSQVTVVASADDV